MLYWLIDLSIKLYHYNVFRYITFRTGGAMITRASCSLFLFGALDHRSSGVRQGKTADPH